MCRVVSGFCRAQESEYAPLSRPHRLFVPIPAQVNFVSQILPTVPFTHPDFPKLKVDPPLHIFFLLLGR